MRLNIRLVPLFLLGVLSALAACDRSATAPIAPRDAPRAALGGSGWHAGEAAYPCTVYRQERGEGHGYRVWKKDVTLFVPRAEVPASGATRVYRYRGYTAGPELAVYADCATPATDAAVRRANQYFGVRPPAEDDAGGAITTQGCETVRADGTCELAPIAATGCQYGGEYPDCISQPEDYDSCTVYAYCSGGGSWGYPETGGGGTGSGWTPSRDDGDGSGQPPCERDAKGACILRPLEVVARPGRPRSEWDQIGVLIERIREDVDYCRETKQMLREMYARGREAGRFQAWDGWQYDPVTGKYAHGQRLSDSEGPIISVSSYWLWTD